MIPRKAITASLIFTLAVVLVGCNLPISPTPTEFVFPTPNQTMTAIFNPPVVIQPTFTPPSSEGQPPTSEPPTTAPTRAPATSTALPPVATAIPPASTPTAAPPPRAAWTATYLSTAPTINGLWDEWNTVQYPMKSVVFGAKNWTGSSDLEGAYRVGWDNTNLYLALKVTDNKYVQNASGADLYKGDSIEILMDANLSGDASSKVLSPDDYQLGVSPGKGEIGKNVEAYLWFPTEKTGALTNLKIAAVPMADGYRVEIAIPWSTFGVTPSDGQRFGFAVSISDNDSSTENVQQKMVSADPSRSLVDPSSWGILTLKK